MRSRKLDLDTMRRRAKEARELLNNQDIPNTPEAQLAAEEVARRSGEVVERCGSPLTIGVVGEYSVGKSLLLGALLGRADLVPVADNPTTGNITALVLSQGSPGSRTGAEPTGEIHYLDAAELSAGLSEIFEGLARELDAAVPDLGAGRILSGYDPVTDPNGWARFDAWYPCLWGAAVAGVPMIDRSLISPVFRSAALELCRIRDAHRAQTDLLGQDVTADVEVLRGALDLPPVTEIPDSPPPSRAYDAVTATKEGVRTDRRILRQTFPLIARVVLKVSVAPEYWDLGPVLAEHGIRLLDFPGIGAAGSNRRDVHLSRRELKNIHTILLVIRAHRSESVHALAFWQMLVDDERSVAALRTAALVAANHFDHVAVPRLADGPQTVEVLRAQSAEVNGVQAISRDFVGDADERVSAVSAVSAIEHYDLAYDRLSTETRDRIDGLLTHLDSAKPAQWQAIATQLEKARPDNTWTPRLRSFADDGGIKGLQELISAHALKHGLEQKTERASIPMKHLEAALAALRREIRKAGGLDQTPEYRALAARHAVLRAFIQDDVIPELVRLTAQAPDTADELGGPPRVKSVTSAVQDAVYDWQEWHRLFERCEGEGALLVRRGERPRERDVDDEDDGDMPVLGGVKAMPSGPGGDPIDSSDVFANRFAMLVERHIALIRTQIDAWLEEWSQRREAPAAEHRTLWGEETLELLTDVYDRVAGSPEGGAERRETVWRALRPDRRVKALGKKLTEYSEGLDRDWARFYPGLAQHAMPWHHLMPELPLSGERKERHPFIVVQLRAHVAEAAARPVVDYLHGLMTVIEGSLLKDYREALGKLASEQEFVPVPRDSFGASADAEPTGDQPIDELLRKWQEEDEQWTA